MQIRSGKLYPGERWKMKPNVNNKYSNGMKEKLNEILRKAELQIAQYEKNVNCLTNGCRSIAHNVEYKKRSVLKY